MKHKSITFFLILNILFIAISNANAQMDPKLQMALGNPSNATSDINNANNYLIERNQYALSYNSKEGKPNWVCWHVSCIDLGKQDRKKLGFLIDKSLQKTFTHVSSDDYTNVQNMQRGHNCPFADRECSLEDARATFYMSNIMPQYDVVNRETWGSLESYCRTLVSQGNELYIISGSSGKSGTIAHGKVTIPKITWKIIVVLPNGANDIERVNTDTRIIAVEIPNNTKTKGYDWQRYKTTVRKIEKDTRYDFLTNIQPAIQEVIETQTDAN